MCSLYVVFTQTCGNLHKGNGRAYSAMVFLPLVILGLWAIYYADEKEYKKGWFYLMVGATGILETQILGTVMTAMFAVVFMLVSYKKTFTKRTLTALLKTAVGSILLNLYFLVPFLDMYDPSGNLIEVRTPFMCN